MLRRFPPPPPSLFLLPSKALTFVLFRTELLPLEKVFEWMRKAMAPLPILLKEFFKQADSSSLSLRFSP